MALRQARCVAEGQRIVVMTGTAYTHVPIEKIVISGATPEILGYDTKLARLKKVQAQRPQMTGREESVLELPLSNGATLRVTPNHKVLTHADGYVAAENLKKGIGIISTWAGFELGKMGLMTQPRPGLVYLESDPLPFDDKVRVFDIITATRNYVCEGVVIHSSHEEEAA